MILIVDGAIAVSFFIVRSPVHWNAAVPPNDLTLAYKFLRMSAHTSCSTGKKCRGIRWLLAEGTLLEQKIDAVET